MQFDRRAFSKTLGGAALASLWSTGPHAEAAAPANIQSLIATERETAKLPALGAAVVSSRGLISLAVSGDRVWPAGPKVSPLDRWHLGSCTKAITATLAARLVERGKLQWSSTIGATLPVAMDPRWRDVPLLWLLCHRSGASMNFDQAIWERMVERGGPLRDQRRYFVTEGLKTGPDSAPGTATAYSNAGFMIAGAMIEQVTDQAWEDLVRSEIFGAMGMRSSGFGPPGLPGRTDQPRGHTRGEGKAWQPVADGPGADNPLATGPAGTAHCSLTDWARFIAAHLSGFRAGNRFLNRDSWKRLHEPGGKDWDYTPGWKVDHTAPTSDPVLQHLGSNGFWLAQATLFPARDRAVLLVSNVADDAAEPVFGRLVQTLGKSPVKPK